MTTVLCPVEPYELEKPMRRGLDDIVRRVAASSAVRGAGNDLLLRIYMAGVYHGVEMGNRAASVIEARRAETLGSVEDESAVPKGDAQ